MEEGESRLIRRVVFVDVISTLSAACLLAVGGTLEFLYSSVCPNLKTSETNQTVLNN